jgi:putative NADH-flavin reductase
MSCACRIDAGLREPLRGDLSGARTRRFRIGGDQLLVDANGRSHIAYEDFAAATLDEIEEPRHIQRRFTVGY